ncbi:MAG: hydroxyethylthiazole kinase, partial [Methanoregulaceae archaeon]|nr:hydroxyethylthiazole kinase [Methanoregulaceae archaeon]
MDKRGERRNAAIFSDIIGAVREKRPLVHHITNYVTVNDCANVTLCIGAAPVMSHAPADIGEMLRHAGALVLNIGTLDPVQVKAMLLAGRTANNLGIPVVLDPVGAGATRYRTDTAVQLMEKIEISVLKGNAGEIGVLAGAEAGVRGVDSLGVAGDPVEITRGFARQTGMTVVMSGPEDVVSDGTHTLLIGNGHSLMGSISGTGCMAASLIGACSAVFPDRVTASGAALAAFGIAGE